MIHIKACNQVRNSADLVLCLGSELGETDWWGKAPSWAKPDEQKLIQVDIDEDKLGRIRQADMTILADVKVFMTQLLEQLAKMKNAIPVESRRAIDCQAPERS